MHCRCMLSRTYLTQEDLNVKAEGGWGVLCKPQDGRGRCCVSHTLKIKKSSEYFQKERGIMYVGGGIVIAHQIMDHCSTQSGLNLSTVSCGNSATMPGN